jgi:hypothetical protein
MGSTPIIGTSKTPILLGKSGSIRDFVGSRTVVHENAEKDRLFDKYASSNGDRLVSLTAW